MAGDDLAAVVERIRSMWQQFEQLSGKADAAYQHGMRYLDDAAEELGDLVQPLRNALNKLKKTIDNALETIRKQLNGPLPVAASFGGGAGAGGTAGGLIDTVLDGYEVLQLMKVWDDEWFEVRNDAFAVATRLKDPEKRLEAHWKGPAALKYYQIVGPQVTAARRVGELADMIGKTLQTVAGAANTFYYALAVALTAILGAIIGAIVAVFGVISAPAAVPLVVGALTASAAIIYGFMSFNDTLAAEASKLLAEVGDTTGFDKGPSWPRAAALSTDVNPHDGSEGWVPVTNP